MGEDSTKEEGRTAILLVHCPDQRGLVSAVTGFISSNQGNIVDLDEHVDRSEGVFFMRVEWELEGFAIASESIAEEFASGIAVRFSMEWGLHFSDEMPRLALFVSRLSHCLYDILSRCESGEWRASVPLVVSNNPELEGVAEAFGADFCCFPITKENKAAQEAEELKLLEEYEIDLVVLARYMQILTDGFVSRYPNRIINIHHSFLPAFPGARPYHSAYERGVKVIGATSHYVTAELDAGPIIAQDVTHVSHRDSVEEMVRKGRDLEKLVLSRAVYNHLKRRVLVYGNRTVVFS